MKTKISLKNLITYGLVLVLLLSVLILTGCSGEQRRTFKQWEKIESERIAAAETDAQYKGKVVKIISDETEELEGGFTSRIQIMEVMITNGPFKGEIIEVRNAFEPNSAYNLVIKEGQGIFFAPEVDPEGNINDASVTEIVRDNYLIVITALFFVALILVGRFKGLRAAISLALTAAAVFFILVPLILRGFNPILISVAVGIGITLITILIIGGINRKSWTAIIGTSLGILIGGSLALIFGNLSGLTGLSNDEAIMLLYIPQNIDFDFRGILFAGIILASLGAVMDVSMSISSSMFEVVKTDPTIKKSSLISSGMNIGRDIIGTMSNTLILVYIGSSIPLILLLMAYKIPFVEVINKDLMASEIIRALSGSIGLILTIPITVLISASFFNLNYMRSLKHRKL